MLTARNYSPIFLLIILLTLSAAVFGQQIKYQKTTVAENRMAFTNPLLLDDTTNCHSKNLTQVRFDRPISTDQQMLFCEAVREISVRLGGRWSPELKGEMEQIWQVFIREDISIRVMEENVSSNVRAMAEGFTEITADNGFQAALYLRPEHIADKSFFPIFLHELQHISDFYELWKNKTSMTEAELEKRAFRLVGKINQELQNNEKIFGMPTFWEAGWKNLSPLEIAKRREDKIEKIMRSSSAYKHLLVNPRNYLIGYLPGQTAIEHKTQGADTANNDERLPYRMKIRQTENELPQQVKDISFTTERAANSKNPIELLRASLKNEKNLYHKMDNFVYDQNLRLQCWKKQKVTENYELNRAVTRTQTGETLFQAGVNSAASAKPTALPSCVLNIEAIKSDATDTFWAAPYLEQMQIKFNYFTVIDGIPVARYTVFEPTPAKFDQIAARYPGIKPFRVFVGTIFVSVEDSQIIKFWGTSFPESSATGHQSSKTYGSYNATAIRQKLTSGIWITTLLNTVAVTYQNNEIKPFSYVVKYQNYRQGITDVKIIDDEAAVVSR